MDNNQNTAKEFWNDLFSNYNNAVPINKKGYECYLKNDFKNAIRFYDEALNLENNMIHSLFYRGLSYYQLDLFKESSQDFKRFINYLTVDCQLQMEHYKNLPNENEYKSTLSAAFFYLGSCHINFRQYKEAIESFSNAIYLDEKYWIAYFYRGNAHAAIDTYFEIKNAIMDYSVVLNFAKDYKMANYLRGFCYAHLGENELAYSDWKLAQQAGLTRNNDENWLQDYFK